MKHRIVIKLKNGSIEHIMASGDTDVVIITEITGNGSKTTSFAKIEPDFIFQIGKSFEAYMGKARTYLQQLNF